MCGVLIKEKKILNNPCEGHHSSSPVAAGQALTSLGHAMPAAGAEEIGQWFGSKLSDLVCFFFFFFLFYSYLLDYLLLC